MFHLLLSLNGLSQSSEVFTLEEGTVCVRITGEVKNTHSLSVGSWFTSTCSCLSLGVSQLSVKQSGGSVQGQQLSEVRGQSLQMDFIIRNYPDMSGCGRVTFGRGVRGEHTQKHPELKERIQEQLKTVLFFSINLSSICDVCSINLDQGCPIGQSWRQCL